MPFAFDSASIQSPRIHELDRYWRGLCGTRAMPRRDEIDPAAIVKLLPNLMIAEIERQPFRVRYRLVGTEVVAVAKFDFTGTYLDRLDFADIDESEIFAKAYQDVCAACRPVYGSVRALVHEDHILAYEFAIFPLSEDGQTVTQCIAIEDYEALRGLVSRMPPSRKR